jgi:cysteine desulfurase
MRPEVIAAMSDALARQWGNPSSPHAEGRAAAAAVDEARRRVAAWVHRDPREVIFTSGATESNALALRGLRTTERPMVVASAVDHPSVVAHADWRVPCDARGVVLLDQLDEVLDDMGHRIAVVSVLAANNETGVLQPIAEIADRCRRHGVPFHCDATQQFGRIMGPIDADLVTLSCHKGGGPKGAGALVTQLPLDALLPGGPQERGRRAGTENVAAIIGFGVAAALAGVLDSAPRDALEAACRRLGGRILGEGADRLPNTVAAVFSAPGDLVVMGLDLEGVAASTGSACASGAPGKSHVLAAMGINGVPVRLSTGSDTQGVGLAVAALATVVARVEEACGP